MVPGDFSPQTILLGNGLHDRCRRKTIPGNPSTKRIYIRISLRGQFMYLTVSMRLTILAVTCTGSAELNALPTDCCRISSLRLTMCCCPTRENLILGGGFRTVTRTRSADRRPREAPCSSRWNSAALSCTLGRCLRDGSRHQVLLSERPNKPIAPDIGKESIRSI